MSTTVGGSKNSTTQIMKTEIKAKHEWIIENCLVRFSNTKREICSPVFPIGAIEARMCIDYADRGAGSLLLSLDTYGDERKAPHQFEWTLSTRNASGNALSVVRGNQALLHNRTFPLDYDQLSRNILSNGALALVLSTTIILSDSEQTIPLRSMHDRLRKLPNELTIDLGNLLEQGAAHADVSFQFPDGTNLRAHRNILSVRSPVFAAMFAHQTTEARDGRVQIEDIPVVVFKLLLSYIYTAKIDIDKLTENAIDLFKAAEKYALQGLKDVCQDALSFTAGTITVANVFEMLLTGEMYSADLLKQAAVDFIRRNGSEVLRTAAWRQFVREQPRLMDYVVAWLAGVPPPEQADYEDRNDANGVDDYSQKEEACQKEPEKGNSCDEDDVESPNKKCKAQ